MKQIMWVLVWALAAGIVYWMWHTMRKYRQKRQAEEARFASFMAQTVSSSLVKPDEAAALAQQKLLFEAAAKAAEAGEPALSIQLYARLLARYPASKLGEQARAGVEEQKKKLTKPAPLP
jgi:hypothetical protein